MSDSIADLLKVAFDEILPIPKTPRVYRAPLPPKPVSWVPSGKLGSGNYYFRLTDFANEIKAINAGRTTPIKYSSRGWCYLLEGLGLIDKGEFSKAQKAINDCRKAGLLPIDFVAEDQDITRRFAGIHEASNPTALLESLKAKVETARDSLASQTTDYWEDEKYYLMMCVEKGDLVNLFKPVCNKYHVPIVNSKGWYPILLRAHIARLSEKAEKRGLTPVLLLFYDHDPAGIKITKTFRKGLHDIVMGTGWYPNNLEIYRFGLNADDVDRYGLMWIDNLKSGSGRESRDWDYIDKYGRRKCESNALFKNDETVNAGMEICRKAIEKYYGEDALERFKEKEGKAKKKLGGVYSNPVWESFDDTLTSLIESLSEEEAEKEEEEVETEKVYDVELNHGFYGECPHCGSSFDYYEGDIGRVVRCRTCNTPMRLKKGDYWN